MSRREANHWPANSFNVVALVALNTPSRTALRVLSTNARASAKVWKFLRTCWRFLVPRGVEVSVAW
jgi:hypothetical protein